MGFTTEAIKKNSSLVASDENRAWEVWDRPAETQPQLTTAFHLFFPTTELAVTPEKRTGKKWKDVVYLEAAPPGKLTTITLFITQGDVSLNHESETSITLASFELMDGRYAKIVAHGDPEGFIPGLIDQSVSYAWKMATEKKIEVPATAFSYFFGKKDNGARFIVGARMHRN
jgi:hypothetical protein